jgi:hypothetical protein
MQFLLYEKDLWEITLGELLPLKVEFGEIFLKEALLNIVCSRRKRNWFVEQFS